MSNNVVVSIITYYMTAIDYSSSWFYFVCNTQSYSRGLAVFLHNTPVEEYANSENPKATSLGCVFIDCFRIETTRPFVSGLPMRLRS